MIIFRLLCGKGEPAADTVTYEITWEATGEEADTMVITEADEVLTVTFKAAE